MTRLNERMRQVINKTKLLTTAVQAAALLSTGAALAQQPIKIGLLLPFKGAYAANAESEEKGFNIAIKEFNSQIAGRPVEIVRADDELTPSVAVQRFNKLVHSDKVDVVAGVISSGVAIALTELAEKNKTPIVFGQAYADEVTGKFCNAYVARTSYSANAYQFASGQYWAKKGLKTAVTLAADYAGGRAFMNAFKRGFEDGGGKVVEQIWTPFQTTKDWSGYLAAAKSAKPQFIYSFYAGAEAVQVVKQHAELGLRTSMPLIGEQFLYDGALWPALGDLVVGTKQVTVHLAELDTPANKVFVDAYVKAYRALPDVNAELGYDNGKSVMLALQKTGGKWTDGAEFIKALNAVQYVSPRGTQKFNKDNNAVLEKLYAVEIVKGATGQYARKVIDTLAGGQDLPGCEKLAAK